MNAESLRATLIIPEAPPSLVSDSVESLRGPPALDLLFCCSAVMLNYDFGSEDFGEDRQLTGFGLKVRMINVIRERECWWRGGSLRTTHGTTLIVHFRNKCHN